MVPRFTVLLPTHNRADVLGCAIRSVLAQTEPRFELLVVGDGCTDESATVVARFDDPRLRWFDLPKGPHSGYNNRNKALAQASGDLIAYAAHDDLWFPDHLARMGAKFENRPAAEWAYSRPLWVTPDGLVIPSSGNLVNADELDGFINDGNFIPSPCVVHRRACFGKYGYWPEDTARVADWLFWRRIIEQGGRANLAYCAVPTVLHFKAIWKERLDDGMSDLKVLTHLARACAWWPGALKLAVDPAIPEQVAFSRKLESGPAWIESVREAVLTVVERLSRDAPALIEQTANLRAELAARDLASENAQAESQELELRLTTLTADILLLQDLLARERQSASASAHALQTLMSSRSWRVTTPLRKLLKLATHLQIR